MRFRTSISALFKEKTDNLFIQFFRYCFVGGLAFLVDYGLLFLLSDKVGLHYLLSASIAFIAGLVVNYVISTFWVFSESKYSDKRKEFAIFAIIGIIGLGLTEGLMWFFTDLVGLHYMLSKLVTAALVLLWNFIARKIILFTK